MGNRAADDLGRGNRARHALPLQRVHFLLTQPHATLESSADTSLLGHVRHISCRLVGARHALPVDSQLKNRISNTGYRLVRARRAVPLQRAHFLLAQLHAAFESSVDASPLRTERSFSCHLVGARHGLPVDGKLEYWRPDLSRRLVGARHALPVYRANTLSPYFMLLPTLQPPPYPYS